MSVPPTLLYIYECFASMSVCVPRVAGALGVQKRSCTRACPKTASLGGAKGRHVHNNDKQINNRINFLQYGNNTQLPPSQTIYSIMFINQHIRHLILKLNFE